MSPFKGNRGVTPPPTAQEKDLLIAFRLLQGDIEFKNGRLVESKFLSSSTKPTEKEARSSLARSLLSIADSLSDPDDMNAALLVQVALLFDPKAKLSQLHRLNLMVAEPTRAVKFKNISKGHAKPHAHFQIAWEVEGLLQSKGKQKAAEAVAEKHNMTLRQVQRICRKVAQVTSDRRSGDMTSDR
jgi:hypothetical protein